MLNEDTSIIFNDEQSSNILDISITLSVINSETSNENIFEHPRNIPDISSTLLVLKILIFIFFNK